MFFYFTAKRPNSEIYEGTMEVPDKLTLARTLRNAGETLLSVKERKVFTISFSFLTKIKTTDIISYARNLAGLIQAGVALARSVEILERQTTNIKMKAIYKILLEDIRSGSSLSVAMEKHPKVFEPLFVSMMKAGEETGNLVGTLREVQTHLERSYALSRKVKGAMIYPSVIIGAMGIIGILMFKFVVPSLLKVFLDFKVELPFTTKIIVGMSDLINNNFILLVVGIIVIIFGIRYLSKTKKFKHVFSIIVLKLPVIGNIAKQTFTARTARTLSSLLTSGVTATRSIEITKEVLSNEKYKAVMDEVIFNIEKGIPMSKAFQAHPDLYPIMMGDMVEVGEESGKVGEMLKDVANFYEEEVDQRTKNLSTIVEPMLMLFIGAAVGFFAIGMMTPMYKMLESVN